MTRIALALVFTLSFIAEVFAQPTQTIRGSVIDGASNQPIPFATVIVKNSAASTGTTNEAGNFSIDNIAVGRYDIQVSCTGYEPALLREIMVSSAKETFLNIKLKQQYNTLNEVVIKPNVNKEQPLNNTATASARMLSVEEAQRYAGGFDDPARLVSAFAGVSSNVSNNAIIIRGNSPQSLQWKMEGVEIPGPNHLGDMRAFGGGTVTALSTQVLANSDFFSGAMPAEYNNALSGVFDIFMRKGNNQKREHTLQVGVVGIDAASEGPFRKGGQSSYLFNYRYSTLALVGPLLAENAGGIKYQDLSFKLHFPTKRAGTFSVWGIGLIDGMGANAKRDTTEWMYDDDRENHRVKQYMGAAGISHIIPFNSKQYLKTTLAATANGMNYPVDRLDSNMNLYRKNFLNTAYSNMVLSSFINTKFSARHTNKTGISITNMNYNLHLQNSFVPGGILQDIAKETGNATLMAAYTNSTIQLGKKLTANAGINGQVFTLNNNYTIEPRAGIKYRFAPKQSLGLAYGLHSRLERLNYYFITNNFGERINKDLDFTKAHHVVLGYDISTSEYTHLKIEAYYQYLFDVPVIADSSFSMLNQQSDWFFAAPLRSTGTGRNYGLDITFEKYLSKGFYYMATASVFHSDYKGGDNVWRNTRYNRGYAINLLAGKEWFSGRNKQNVFGVNARISYQGGDWYSPVNTGLSAASKYAVTDEREAFSLQYPAAFTSHLTVSYKINKKHTAHTIALKILNLNQYEEYLGYRYNYYTNRVDIYREPSVVPNISYRIDF